MRIKRLLLILLVVVLFTGCSKKDINDKIIKEQEHQIVKLNSEIKSLKKQKKDISKIVVQEKQEKGVAKYIVTINIKQSHFALDIENNIKDELNDIDIEIPVDKEFYDKVTIGTVLDDSFRMGSLILKGSFGKWNITVSDKEIR